MIVGNALGNPLSNGVGFMSPVNSTGYTMLERTVILQAESDTGYTGSAHLDLIGTASGTASATGSSLASTISAVAPNSASGTLRLPNTRPALWYGAISAFPSSPVFSCSATGAEFEGYLDRGTSGEDKFIAAGARFSMDPERKAPTIINVHNTTGGNIVYWQYGDPRWNEKYLPVYHSGLVYRIDALSRSSSDDNHFYSYYYGEPYVGRLTLHNSWFSGSSLSGLRGGAADYGRSIPPAYTAFMYTVNANKFDHIDAFIRFGRMSVIKGSAVVKLHNAKNTSTVYFESALSSGDSLSGQMVRFSLPTSDVKAVYELRVDVGYNGMVNMVYPAWGFTGVTK